MYPAQKGYSEPVPRVGFWVEGEEARAFLRRLNLPLRRIRGEDDPALAEIGGLILEAGRPRPAFRGPVWVLGEDVPLSEEGLARLRDAIGPFPSFPTSVWPGASPSPTSTTP